MSSILNRIYNTLNEVINANNMQAKITCFRDFGSRLLDQDLNCFVNYNQSFDTSLSDPFFPQRPTILLHDQEPLMFTKQKQRWLQWRFNTSSFDDRMIILTSERNSRELDEFCKSFNAVPCHFFSNGVLACEWFHEHRWSLRHFIPVQKPRLHYKFSCLNRLISEQRCYRPIISRFLQTNVDSNFLRLSCMLTDPVTGDTPTSLDIPAKYKFMFKNLDFNQPILINTLGNEVDTNNNIHNDSFNPVAQYFISVFCHIVTETLFTEDTLHLTEKSLRPFINKRPMLMLGPPHSLSYLRSYGFRTFGDFWDESYDDIQNPWDRLEAVMKIINDLNKLSLDDMESMLDKMEPICEHNFRHFYQDFPNVIINELITNVKYSITQTKSKPMNGWMLNRIKELSESRINGLLNGPIVDEFSNRELYRDYQQGNMTNIDHNLARLLRVEHNFDKESSKEEILARFHAALD